MNHIQHVPDGMGEVHRTCRVSTRGLTGLVTSFSTARKTLLLASMHLSPGTGNTPWWSQWSFRLAGPLELEHEPKSRVKGTWEADVEMLQG